MQFCVWLRLLLKRFSVLFHVLCDEWIKQFLRLKTEFVLLFYWSCISTVQTQITIVSHYEPGSSEAGSNPPTMSTLSPAYLTLGMRSTSFFKASFSAPTYKCSAHLTRMHGKAELSEHCSTSGHKMQLNLYTGAWNVEPAYTWTGDHIAVYMCLIAKSWIPEERHRERRCQWLTWQLHWRLNTAQCSSAQCAAVQQHPVSAYCTTYTWNTVIDTAI